MKKNGAEQAFSLPKTQKLGKIWVSSCIFLCADPNPKIKIYLYSLTKQTKRAAAQHELLPIK